MVFRLESRGGGRLAAGERRVEATFSVASEPRAGGRAPPERVVGLVVDASRSMAGERMLAATTAVGRVLERLETEDGAWFFVVTFASTAHVLVPPTRVTQESRIAAVRALGRVEPRG